MKTKKTIEARVEVQSCGKSSGVVGTAAYYVQGEEDGVGHYYFDPLDLLDRLPEHGARIRVTVELLEGGRIKPNPWFADATGEGWEAQQRAEGARIKREYGKPKEGKEE